MERDTWEMKRSWKAKSMELIFCTIPSHPKLCLL
jgi:hypothetical protein